MTQTMTGTATQKQVDFIHSLLTQKAGSYRPEFGTKLLRALEADAISKAKASEVIEWLIRRPKATAAAAATPTTTPTGALKTEITEGFWITDSDAIADSIDIWKVQKNLAGTAIYAKRLVITPLVDGKNKGKFNYVAGGLSLMAKHNPRVMTLDEAKAYGKLYGVCSRCGATLTHEDSIERMMGPVCYGYLVGAKGHGL